MDAWAGLDPLMASAEVEAGAKLFFRKPEANTWGILNVREAFAKENPALVKRVLATYEKARALALANPAELNGYLVAATKLPAPVIAKQLERTELTHSKIGAPQAESILAAGTEIDREKHANRDQRDLGGLEDAEPEKEQRHPRNRRNQAQPLKRPSAMCCANSTRHCFIDVRSPGA